jgi:aryl-alcohol dehydrogenase-like predicted oxidoreductase
MTPPTSSRRLGALAVGPIGLGAMNLSGEGTAARDRAFATVRAAVEQGVTLIDTADAYGPAWSDFHVNERLIADAVKALGSAGQGTVIATKGGHTRTRDRWDVDGRPSYLREACDRSRRALGVDCIDLYQHHRPDPAVPYEDSIGALHELRQAGKIRMVGISNASVAQIRTAVEVLGDGGLASVQNELSPEVRTAWPQLEECASRGIGFLAYSPLGGVGSGHRLAAAGSAFSRVARARGTTVQRVALAWELALGPHVVPIPGCSRPATMRDCAAAPSLTLDPAELHSLTAG